MRTAMLLVAVTVAVAWELLADRRRPPGQRRVAPLPPGVHRRDGGTGRGRVRGGVRAGRMRERGHVERPHASGTRRDTTPATGQGRPTSGALARGRASSARCWLATPSIGRISSGSTAPLPSLLGPAAARHHAGRPTGPPGAGDRRLPDRGVPRAATPGVPGARGGPPGAAHRTAYLMSLGSQSGNRHVHWHGAPLPPGVPDREQQLAALSWERGVVALPDHDMADLAGRLRARVERMRQGL
jgi:hypothetical protein